MNRREFLQAFASSQPEIAHLPTVPTAGSPRQYRAGTRVLVEDVQAWLCRDELGFYAIDAHCPHLGGLVRLTDAGFTCPGHGSRFSTAGERKNGAAPCHLPFLYVDLDAVGFLVIHRDRCADPNERLIA
ncbi:MAG TPA: Rieske (2Fe-2S) protein [Phototrophicaceae bacterium]|nr:Rieske (2Fe-2S) protein [Phototrophicaceae bacterium]